MSFHHLGLKPEVLQAIEDLGFEQPTPVQEQAIPVIVNEQKDLIVLAQTGTGKTGAFGLPLVHKVDVAERKVQALVLCPTRELCLQITNDLQNYSKYTRMRVTAVYGGASIVQQMNRLKEGSQVVVGTPGRTKDLIERGALKIDHISYLVFDEADEMLNMGFKDDLDDILRSTPREKQTLLFSATMPEEISRIASEYMRAPAEISVGRRNSGNEDVSHEYYLVHAKDRFEALRRIIDVQPDIYGIIFCRTKVETREVAAKLMEMGYNAEAMHGDLAQAQRDDVIKRFKDRTLRMLVATDVAARGLDIDQISHVINYNLPDDPEVYIHRSGRTGRAGKKGVSISIINMKEKSKLHRIEKLSKRPFEHKKVPSGKEVVERQLAKLVNTIEHTIIHEDDKEPFRHVIKQLEWMDKEDLIVRVFSNEFSRLLKFYKNVPDLNVDAKNGAYGSDEGRGRRSDDREGGSGGRREGRRGSDEDRFDQYAISLGSGDRMNAALIIGVINENTKDKSLRIGRIQIEKNYSLIEIEKGKDEMMNKSFRRAKYKGTPVYIEKLDDIPVPAAQKRRKKK